MSQAKPHDGTCQNKSRIVDGSSCGISLCGIQSHLDR